MNIQDQDDLDAWLVEVELASQKIKDLAQGKVKVEDFDRKEKERLRKKEEEKRKKEQEEERLRMEEYERKKQGRKGKGVENNYLSFCKFCFWEYELPTPQCIRCNKDTITYDQRMEELKGKVDDYKKHKVKRDERKKKWELWKKTQSMLWKKTSTNYSKWDYYTSESDSEPENSEPVVPKDDPNFKALEMDIEQRKKKRANDRIIAEGYKQKGNDAMAKEDYKQAVEMYSLGLDSMKDIKALWTNRALAYIKLKKYSKAIEDCTRILDYCECFEEGYTKSRDSAFKAFLRRSYARKEKKDYKQALDDILEALKLYPNDKAALDLKTELEFIQKHKEQASKLLPKHEFEVLNPQSENQQKNQAEVQNAENKKQENEDEDEEDQDLEERKVENRTDQKQAKVPLSEKQTNQHELNEVVKDQKESVELQQKPVDEQDKTLDQKAKLQEQNIDQTQQNGCQSEQKQVKTESQPEQNNNKENIQTENQNKDEGDIKKRAQKVDRNRNYKKCVDYFMAKDASEIDDDDLKEIVEHIARNNEAKIYFFEKKATARIENLLKLKKQCYLLANTLIDDNILYQTQFLKNECHLLIQSRVQELLSENQNQASGNYSEIEDAFEVLNTLSTLEQTRNKLSSDKKTIEFVKNMWEPLVKIYQKEPYITSNYLIFVSNMCYGQTTVKKNLITDLNKILNDLNNIMQNEKKKFSFESLRENCYNLIANLLTEESVRLLFSQDKYTQVLETVIMRITYYDLAQNPKYLKSAEAALALLVNISFQATPQMQVILKRLCTDLIIIGRFFKLNWRNQQYFEVYNRSLQILAKLDYTDSKLAERLFELQDMFENEKFAGHLIRLYANITTNPSQVAILKDSKKVDFKNLSKILKKYMNQDEETKFCNSCNLASYINEFVPDLLIEYKETIPRLITVCKEKTGNLRKNAAIFLAKLAKNQQNLEVIRSLHGIEILHSITSLVVQK
ncbi:tetratricopeptide repeat protein (macronuclear) [Tetrahymena thermophila SB210]|uniref:Tetratricopeptide repeat protein n=1 Tax=Tetrahymena thermophila (strain SB210) TaxID=312017 RepID=I7M9X7_TETTS|nr:tetratricopeptide repeat protein [Tetrahymena thermophila SB210]EAS03008.1 tetratricopeptide repeat protein [Tetrahymena thermophila SB210]|eukprot:XP_001023253.1 tetratricopeptide repeat protein [Tetrahymena thermophila SB210]